MTNRSTSVDVAVIGGGVIGLGVAWRAAQRGMRVVLLERDRAGSGTSRVAAGMLAPITEADPREQPLLALGQASAAAYPRFVEELSEASGMNPGYLPCGTLMVARDADESEALERELAMREGLGLPVQRLRASEARRLEPALAPSLRLALEIPGDHVIEPDRLIAALAAGLVRAGGELRDRTVVADVLVEARRVTGVRLRDGSELRAEHVVIAAGIWSGQIGGLPADARVPLRPVKGQVLRLHDPAGPGLLTRIIRMPPGYIAPRGDGRYALGATMEERGFDTTVTAGAVFELLRDALELVPGASELVIDELCAGLRPGTPDNLPAIGTGALAGLHWAVGHHRNGILLTPVTAELLAAELAGESAPALAAAFDPGRFAATPATVGGGA
ncbi:MAG TPA: glycine oxidase ThiO [Solirubrobacteraceae bacterium]|nr:glycine oxidase ThiO [Solirubrobacteraceae bacterium]